MSRHQDPAMIRARHERARREIVLGAIRADLEEKPSPAAVRAASRRWCQAIGAIGAAVLDERRHAA